MTDTATLRFDPRLWQLISPASPTGAFHFSQGLEQAIDNGTISSAQTASDWLAGLLRHGVARVDVPLLVRTHRAAETQNVDALRRWDELTHACRETRELRNEEVTMGLTFTQLCRSLAIDLPAGSYGYTCAFGWAAHSIGVGEEDMLGGYLWAWLENQTLVATKLIPLGHLEGQQVLARLSKMIEVAVNVGRGLKDDEIGMSLPGWIHASVAHESQYSRVFRS
ncbi:MAG: urease accessory UreF family protein [Pseudomonadota bacterium]